MFRKVLIANRGEIACRIIRTCKSMGIGTVAVYSEADRSALHVEMADEAAAIGEAPPQNSYLSIGAILDAARKFGVDAIHPGYGFLSENADFAQSTAQAGFTFVGAPVSAMRAMGLKAAGKSLAADLGIPTLPSFSSQDQSAEAFGEAARRIGFPILIKASAGGGGRGMRHIFSEEALAGGLDAARREALSSFANGHLLIEKFLSAPRHIEIQLLSDNFGNHLYLGARDCSIQRRYQKIVEEATAPYLDAGTLDALGTRAVEIARAIGYRGAGTIEFIADTGAGLDASSIYFMEMNTRLQVEHPVTEMVTGLDIVEWQLRIAAGEALPFCQAELRTVGHAIEVRLCAENVEKNYLPSPGPLDQLSMPAGEGIRCDTGVRAGDRVTPYYDSLLAKIVAHGADREQARLRMVDALRACVVTGVKNNLGLLQNIVSHPAFVRAALNTNFLEEWKHDLIPAAIRRLGADAISVS